MVEWRFEEREDQLIEADLGPNWSGFSEALNDAVSTRAPRGHPSGLSTYWIDRTLESLGGASQPGAVLASGNATSLIHDGRFVVAHSDYDLWGDERMSVDDFVSRMEAWRAAVQDRLRERS